MATWLIYILTWYWSYLISELPPNKFHFKFQRWGVKWNFTPQRHHSSKGRKTREVRSHVGNLKSDMGLLNHRRQRQTFEQCFDSDVCINFHFCGANTVCNEGAQNGCSNMIREITISQIVKFFIFIAFGTGKIYLIQASDPCVWFIVWSKLWCMHLIHLFYTNPLIYVFDPGLWSKHVNHASVLNVRPMWLIQASNPSIRFMCLIQVSYSKVWSKD